MVLCTCPNDFSAGGCLKERHLVRLLATTVLDLESLRKPFRQVNICLPKNWGRIPCQGGTEPQQAECLRFTVPVSAEADPICWGKQITEKSHLRLPDVPPDVRDWLPFVLQKKFERKLNCPFVCVKPSIEPQLKPPLNILSKALAATKIFDRCLCPIKFLCTIFEHADNNLRYNASLCVQRVNLFPISGR